MLSEEELKSIDELIMLKHFLETEEKYEGQEREVKAIETVLNLVTKLQKENEDKDKQIDLMAKKLNQAYFDEDKFFKWFEKMMGVQEKMDYGYVVDLIKQYFEKLAKEKGE